MLPAHGPSGSRAQRHTMSNILRALRNRDRRLPKSDEELDEIIWQLTGQRSSLSPRLGALPLGDPAADYLNDPSAADLLMKNAKSMTIHDLLKQARSEDGNPQMAPMIASIQQLDR